MGEVFDVLDENGVRTGKTVGREAAHRDGVYHLAAILFLVNSKGQVLLQKRSHTKQRWPGCWDGAGGGHVGAGELGLFCVIRELEEELGVRVEPGDVRYIGVYRSNTKDGAVWDAHFNEFYVAHKDVDIKDIKLQASEVEDIKWVDFAKFKKMVKDRDAALTTKWQAFDALIHYVEKYCK